MTGLKAFVIVLLLMPLGHALMVVMNKFLGDALIWGAAAIFLLGFAILLLTRFTDSSSWQSFLGCFAGVLMWTGVVEYGLYFGAISLDIPKLDGTAGEYRLMTHTWGFLLLLVIYLLFHEGVRCTLFVWLRRKLHLVKGAPVCGKVSNYGPRTAFEMVSILWFFYVLLLLLYDESILGAHHPATYACLFLSIAVGLWLGWRLIRIRNMGYALRYAIPTVIIIWNVVEILGHWNIYQEPWIVLNIPIMVTIIIAFLGSMYFVLKDLTAIKKGTRSKTVMPTYDACAPVVETITTPNSK